MTTSQTELFNKLFEENYQQLIYQATHALNNHFIAEEVVGAAFEKLIEKIDQVQRHDNPGGWLSKVTQNLIANERKRAVYRFEQSYDCEEGTAPQAEERRFEKLEYSLPKGLTEKEKKLLIWYFEEHYSYETIAKMLRISTVNCRTMVFRAKTRCGKLLKHELAKKLKT